MEGAEYRQFVSGSGWSLNYCSLLAKGKMTLKLPMLSTTYDKNRTDQFSLKRAIASWLKDLTARSL